MDEKLLYSTVTGDCESYYKEQAAAIQGAAYDDVLGDFFFSAVTRAFDIVLGTIGLLLSIPVFLVVGLLIKVEDGGPVFYRQERVGLHGRHFTLYKLRSMTVNAEVNGAQWAEQDDRRVTRVGRFIRKTRIDELPQLLNVIIGNMSLIGPRPERPEFILRFDQEIPGFIYRLQVKPGLTGWAQVNGGYDVTPEEKLKLDLFYIENRGILLNLRILVKTLRVILTGDGAR
jgi:exopolysaccharide biosynthesis polyprenyl glycosylphosphotransferase